MQMIPSLRVLAISFVASCLAVEAVGCGGNDRGEPADAGERDAGLAVEAGPRQSSCVDPPEPSLVDISSSNEVLVLSDPPATLGIFDPSVVTLPGTSAAVMAYSGVVAKDDIVTRIALSNDGGGSWTYVASANAPVAVGDLGHLIHEVSSLVFDVTDPEPARRWKLFSHRYFANSAAVRYDLGHVSLQTAAVPEGPWSEPVANVGWRSESPLSSDGAALVAQDVPGLADCIVLTEPSALVLPDGRLALSVGCVSGASDIRVELLLSSDHAASWISVGTLVEARDATCLSRSSSVNRVNAGELFLADNRLWLFASPEGEGYRGCALLEVTDVDRAKIARDDGGAPLVTRLLAPPGEEIFSGACAHDRGLASPYISVAHFDGSRLFRIYRSGIAAP